MLKRLLLLTLALMFVLGLSGAASAMLVNLTQSGSYNFAFVGQYGTGNNEANITQQDSPTVNTLFLVQVAPDNVANVTQQTSAFLNIALIDQSDASVNPDWHDIQSKIEWAIDVYYTDWLNGL